MSSLLQSCSNAAHTTFANCILFDVEGSSSYISYRYSRGREPGGAGGAEPPHFLVRGGWVPYNLVVNGQMKNVKYACVTRKTAATSGPR